MCRGFVLAAFSQGQAESLPEVIAVTAKAAEGQAGGSNDGAKGNAGKELLIDLIAAWIAARSTRRHERIVQQVLSRRSIVPVCFQWFQVFSQPGTILNDHNG